VITAGQSCRRDRRATTDASRFPKRSLDFLNNRHYDPTTGVFVSVDPLVTMTGEPYVYGSANPVRFSDPSGLCVESFYVNADGSVGFVPMRGAECWAGDAEDSYKSGGYSKTTQVGHREQDRVGTGCKGSGCSEGADWSFFSGLGKLFLFDPGACDDTVSWGCSFEVGAALPWGRVGRLARWAGNAANGGDKVRDVDNVADALGVGNDVAKACGLRSFSAETPVLMADGSTKPISEVQVGDMVVAEDPVTGVRGARVVTHLWAHVDELVDLVTEAGSVRTTEDHPFWNESDREWQWANGIDPGEKLLTDDGGLVAVGGLDETTAANGWAYNLTVDGIHTYYVEIGLQHVLVHNTDGCNLWKLTREGANSTKRHGTHGTFYETVNRNGDSMWLTVDNSRHGSSFKMYEETSRGLQWVADLDATGTIIDGKHKGPIGRFIPWKELAG